MVAQSLKQRILDMVDKLSPQQQQLTLEYVRKLSRSHGRPAHSLRRFAGRIPLDDVERMEQAIQEGCEQIDQNGW